MTSYALFCPQGASQALLGELADRNITATTGGTDWLHAQLSPDALETVLNFSQCTTHVIELLVQGSRDEIEAYAKTRVKPAGTFAVRATGEDRQDIQETVGGFIKDASGATVNLSKPDTQYLVLDTGGEYLFGVDVSGTLGKRHYKIITGAQSLTGPVAYSVLRLSGWNTKKDLVIWPSGTGELAIEAALAATGKSPRAYERKLLDSHEPTCRIICADPKLSLVRSAEKNAKVAGIHHAIRFSRQDADWLDTKYEEHQVTLLVGLLPNLKLQPKLVKEIYYQLEYILKPGGVASFLCVNEDSATLLEAQADEYTPARIYIWSGKHCFTLVTLSRNKKTAKKKTKP